MTSTSTQELEHIVVIRQIHYYLKPFALHPVSDSFISYFQNCCGISSCGKANNKFLHYYFKFASATGDEMFGLIPILFWTSLPTAKTFILAFGIFLMTGQIIKDCLRLPRPNSPKIVKMEKEFEKEFGFPSTHTISAMIPLSVVTSLAQRHQVFLSPAIWISLIIFVISVACSRMYLGVHSLLDIAGGSLIGICLAYSISVYGESMESWIYHDDVAIFRLCGFALAFLALYPRSRPWSAGYGTAATIFGTFYGVSLSVYYLYHSAIGAKILSILEETSLHNLPLGDLENHSDLVKKCLCRYAVAAVLVGLIKLTAKPCTTRAFLWLKHLGFIQVPKEERVDIFGRPVPLHLAYDIEIPGRLVS